MKISSNSITTLMLVILIYSMNQAISQNAFAKDQTYPSQLEQQIGNIGTTKLTHDDSILVLNQTAQKLVYKMGENITVDTELMNIGNKTVEIKYCEPWVGLEIKDQTGIEIWPNSQLGCIPEFIGTKILQPGEHVNVQPWGVTFAPYSFLHPVLSIPGNYTVTSVALFTFDMNSTNLVSTEPLWSKPIQITILPEKYLQNKTNHTIPQSVKLTPFDISFLKNDFNRTGVSHQVLVLKPNQTSSIHAMIYNNDNKTQQVYLQVPMENLGSFVSSYSFEPSTLTIYPHSVNETILHITAADINDTQTGLVSVLAQDNPFGMKSTAFYLAVGNDIPESRLDWIDQSLREAMPGAAFPNLHPFQETENKIIPGNVFGMPRYLPKGYQLQGFSESAPGPLLVYSPVQITTNTTMIDFLHSGGIVSYYEVNSLALDLNKWMTAYVGQNEAQEVIINGITGVAIEQQKRQTDNMPFTSPAVILLFKGTSQLEMYGNISLDELLKVASSVPVINESHTVSAQCLEDKDFPGKPCNDAIDTANPNQKPILGDKSDWQAFYNMKGKEWIESKKQEMYFADQNGILKEWYEYGGSSGHFANSDVWYYYNLYGQSPDIMKYYNDTIQKDWTKPIITYYYVSPIIFVIIGIITVTLGFSISKKILVRISK